jgi:hypothetical protein
MENFTFYNNKQWLLCEMLHDGLKLVIWNKQWRQPSKGVLLLHYNACPHTADTLH